MVVKYVLSQAKHACTTIPLGKGHIALVTMTQTLNANGYSQTQLPKNVWMFLFHSLVLFSMAAHLY